MVLKNLIISIRNLRRNKLNSFIGIIGFAAGFSICLIIGLFVYNELTMDSYHENHDRIYRLVNTETKSADIDYELNKILIDNYSAIDKTCPIYIHSSWNADVYADDKSIYVKGLIATNNAIFEIFSIKVLKSSSSEPFANKNASVITESTAIKIFGDTNALGKTLKVGRMETVISAIITDFPSNSSIIGNILLNSENPAFRLNMGFANGKRFTFTNHYLLLNKSESFIDLKNTLNETIGTYHKNIKKISLQPLNDIYLSTSVRDGNKHGNIDLIKIISIIGIMILLLSVINYINYILSLQLKRMKEIGIKKANGAETIHIVAYYLSEVLLWVVIAFGISQLFIKVSLPFFNQIFQEELRFGDLYSISFISGILLVLGTIIFLSCIPILILLSRFNFQRFINDNVFKIKSKIRSSMLPIFQLSISILLIIGVLVVQKQIFYAKHKDLGFNDNALLYVNIPYRSLDPQSFKDELLKHPSIEKVSLSSGVPGDISSRMTNPKWDFTLYQMNVDEDYIETMQMSLLEGRNISNNDNKECIVNEATLKAFELQGFVGEKIKYGNDDLEIVGVVKDFNMGSIHEKIQPLIIKYGINRNVSIRISGDNIAEAMNYINKIWKNMSSGASFKYDFYDMKFDAMYKKEELLAYACTIFAIIAIIITCLGLWGQIIFISDNRTKEIGIRKVNGATIKEILIMLNKDFIKWMIISFVIACPVAYYAMSKWLENFAYKTTLSWWVFALAGIFTLAIVLFTVSWQSYRAATRNPVEALRDE